MLFGCHSRFGYVNHFPDNQFRKSILNHDRKEFLDEKIGANPAMNETMSGNPTDRDICTINAVECFACMEEKGNGRVLKLNDVSMWTSLRSSMA